MDGSDVIDQGAKVYSKDGKDVTAEYLKGAKMSLDIALENEVGLAILKESSPSCGSSLIHDGNFVGNKKPGQGVTVALLKKHGIKTISEKDLDNLENILSYNKYIEIAILLAYILKIIKVFFANGFSLLDRRKLQIQRWK